ncbi:hypothetical protein RSOLAG1IB_04071 [Rhizoctonia solani AG-1 IB]|uniref:Uncharacterized protein n=1 Tax=Thanatephorus cucumeris (strain AG1-IB / isolate 7/3/14) TaxID=1108050 RepID=A0A0B7FXB3_THACB|nr:hypothetical protein RSOLAG1IB_04071 [Rhizoctonia solani AG-1 IB]
MIVSISGPVGTSFGQVIAPYRPSVRLPIILVIMATSLATYTLLLYSATHHPAHLRWLSSFFASCPNTMRLSRTCSSRRNHHGSSRENRFGDTHHNIWPTDSCA